MDWNLICDLCIEIMESASATFGVSYGFINVFLFIIMQPLAILAMFVAYILQRMKKNKMALAFCIIGISIVAFILVCLIIAVGNMKVAV